MQESKIKSHLQHVLKGLFINVTTKCNLSCVMCYVKKDNKDINYNELLSFIERYKNAQKLNYVFISGGEPTIWENFISFSKWLYKNQIYEYVITNGTNNKVLSDLSFLSNNITFIVSIDGPSFHHNLNRGRNTYQSTLQFAKKAINMGFDIEIATIVTKQNIADLHCFDKFIHEFLGKNIPITYHPRKPYEYISRHDKDNICYDNYNLFQPLDLAELQLLMKKCKTFPPKRLGCYQISVDVDGKIYDCCENVHSIGSLDDDVTILINQFINKVWGGVALSPSSTLGCTNPRFMCGMRDVFNY